MVLMLRGDRLFRLAWTRKGSQGSRRNPALSDGAMTASPRGPAQDELLRPRLTDMIDMRHALAQLGH